jgi:hypothetical protein
MMLRELPKHLIRHPQKAAVDSLAARFGLRNEPDMQDWEWEVSDPTRIDEFLAAYESGELNDDEKFLLMQIIIDSSEEAGDHFLDSDAWAKILSLIEANIALHIYSVWYWSSTDNEDLEDCWRVARSMRILLAKYSLWIKCQTH